MTTIFFMKANCAGDGYTHFWPEGISTPKVLVVDDLLPFCEAGLQKPPYVAYSAGLLTLNQQPYILASVGGYWTELRDEGNRPGLFLYQGFAVPLSEVKQNGYLTIAERWINLVWSYENSYNDIGFSVGKLAVDRSARNEQIRRIWHLSTINWVAFTASSQDLLRNVTQNLSQLPEHANLLFEFPIHHLFAIPCMLVLMERGQAKRIGGGCLSPTTLDQYQCTSVPQELSSRHSTKISIVDSSPVMPKGPPSGAKEPYPDQISGRKRLIGAVLVVVGIILSGRSLFILTISAYFADSSDIFRILINLVIFVFGVVVVSSGAGMLRIRKRTEI